MALVSARSPSARLAPSFCSCLLSPSLSLPRRTRPYAHRPLSCRPRALWPLAYPRQSLGRMYATFMYRRGSLSFSPMRTPCVQSSTRRNPWPSPHSISKMSLAWALPDPRPQFPNLDRPPRATNATA
ncbi:hypothetical protein OH76DRAFT_332651 [Lentinus brumalis]|uniref:Uncharacterized protein n=1 Tax=Lentinus brumalis TaxID=2498619 RepID=A0A371CJV5_9APHY|nr:hypothetical protein OH76DRAFT_332651 [Polyporus brumalis]